MRQGSRRLLLVIGFVLTGIYIGISVSKFIASPTTVTSTSSIQNHRKRDQVCVQPKLNPFEGDYAKHFYSVDPVKCSEDTDWVSVSNGTVFITSEAKKKQGSISCKLTYFDRIDDFQNKDMDTVTLTDSSVLSLKSDFVKVHCTGKDKNVYENVHVGVRNVPEYHKKAANLSSSLGLDVLMLGFDSLSHMTYIRKLKKTYKYFTDILKGTTLNGYNIVGDGTPQALIPIFTGKTELELPRTLKRLAKKDFVDIYPMVWKDFQKNGYVTAWGEDCPDIGTFTYRMVGFKDNPTDHYMRPFHVTAQKQYYGKHKKLCLGSKRRSEVFMQWIRDIYTTYDKVPKFVFGFHSEVSHGDNNMVETADEDLFNLLKFLNDGKYLRNTLVILMSDHGARFSSLRSSLQGKQEERLPFFGFSFPEWFKTKHSSAYRNFKLNVDRLTCPFDLHPTFLDILNFKGVGKGDINNRGISLFKEIPKTRSCVSAGIETHWCACLNWESLNNDDQAVLKVSNYVVSEINKLTETHRKLCQKLTLKNVFRAQKLLPETDMLLFKQTNDADGFRADLSDNTAVVHTVYQVWIYTTPGDGLFEVTVNHNMQANTFILDESSISRVNKYGNAPKCIEKEHEELRKYCYCYK
ncbi:uncharacterized protein LOC127737399 [Mytilus californianus]|uniref:uncharacterized protein LOC127737399 n=1 Tax=Mytilus californianus TaxID=6549 RepID=UPI002247FE5B|nr:uncharacterized protein LOC127737399 [Mytilus californianus]